MKIDWTISALGHAALLGWALVSFSGRPLATPPEGLPVDIVSAKEFSEVMAGVKKAPPAPKPRPLVEKIAEKKPVEDAKPKVSEKPEIKEAKLEPPPMPEPRPKPPEPKPVEAKHEPKPPEPKPAPKPAEKKEVKKEPKVDEIAEALKKAEAKKREEQRKEQHRADQLKKVIDELQKDERAKKKREEEQPRFDPAKVAALLDKRDPQRHQATGDALNQTASLGLPSATSARLSQSEIDALRARLAQLWNPPAGARNPEELVVRVRVRLSRDGRLAGPPQVLTSGSSVLFTTARESAVRALFRGQPFDMLRPEHYEHWKDIEITFDPRDMMRG
jgi:colicin import membrane protein